MKKGTSKRLTPEQRAELKSLAALRDDAIDTSDAPELLDWSGAKRGLFYRPVKQQLTLRLDADVVAWFKSHTTSNEGYQTRINRALREYVQGQASRDSAIQGIASRSPPFLHTRCGSNSAVFVGSMAAKIALHRAKSYSGAPRSMKIALLSRI